MDDSPILFPAPATAPASIRSSLEPIPDELPQHTKPSLIKVRELPVKQRQRAETVVSKFEKELEDTRIRASMLRIGNFRASNPLRIPADDQADVSVLKVEKQRQSESFPAKQNKPQFLPARQAVSAPVGSYNVPGKRLPGSPIGNAWSGEHFWTPQFSQSVRSSMVSIEQDGCGHSDPLRRLVYESVLAEVEKGVSEVKTEAALRGEPMSNAECNIVAAMQVLDDSNERCAKDCNIPVPTAITKRTKELAEQEEQAALNSIHHFADLSETKQWLQLEERSLQYTTILDYMQANLRLLRERRKSAGLQPTVLMFAVVYAMQILEEKVRKWKAKDSYEESSDEEVGYGHVLRSIEEELHVNEIRRLSKASTESRKDQQSQEQVTMGQVNRHSRRGVSIGGVQRQSQEGIIMKDIARHSRRVASVGGFKRVSWRELLALEQQEQRPGKVASGSDFGRVSWKEFLAMEHQDQHPRRVASGCEFEKQSLKRFTPVEREVQYSNTVTGAGEFKRKSLKSLFPMELENQHPKRVASGGELERQGLKQSTPVEQNQYPRRVSSRNGLQQQSQDHAAPRPLSGVASGNGTEQQSQDHPALRAPSRVASGLGIEQRRLKGKAPSALDLAAWASSLREMDEDQKIGIAITKDD